MVIRKKIFRFFGIAGLISLLALLLYSCGQQETPQTTTTTSTTSTTSATGTTTTTSTTSTTQGPSAGYVIYDGTDPSSQKFSFEYPEGWTLSQEALTSDWNSGTWIAFLGPGDWETGVPLLSLWIVPKGEGLTNEASYDAAVYADRAVSAAVGDSPGLIFEVSTTETVAGLSARGWRIAHRTIFPLGQSFTEGTEEVDTMMSGDLVSAETEWRVFQKGNYLYDLKFLAVADKVSSREAFLHAKNTFRFN